MKVFWILGCIWGGLHYVELAIEGRTNWGELSWLAVTLDWLTVGCFVAALIGAVRAKAPWWSLMP